MSFTVGSQETVTPAPSAPYRPIQVAPPDGPWALDCVSSNAVVVRWGRVVYENNVGSINIKNLGKRLPVSESNVTYINLHMSLSNGIVTDASIDAETAPPVYRNWAGNGRSVETQTQINVCLNTIHPGDEYSRANTYLYIGTTASYGVYRCVYTDLMLYKVCDGLIVLPAPYSLP